MKQKFALSVADTEINVITEESKEVIDTIVGIVDRRIREINNRNCPKNEAAILLCLDYCADKLNLQKKIKNSDVELNRIASLNEELLKENAELKKQIEELKTNSAVKVKKPVETAQLTIEAVETPVVKTELKVETPKPEVVATKKKVEPIVEPQITTDGKDELPIASNKKKANDRVRSMFDMITFDDINN